MHTFESPPSDLNRPNSVDELLRGFFRKAMPRPWPAFRAPEPPSLPSRPRVSSWSRWRSPLALAATVALLLLGYLALASRMPATVPAPAGREGIDAGGLGAFRDSGLLLRDEGIILKEDGTSIRVIAEQPSGK